MTTLFDGQGKVGVLRDYATRYPRNVMVETGIYSGHGSGMHLRDLTARYIVLDLNPDNCAKVKQTHPEAEVWQGDSALTLPLMLRLLDEPALFWLDAHLCEEFDADDPIYEEHPCPLMTELDALIAWEHGALSVILIDDLRCMGVEPTFPTLEELRAKVETVWDVSEANDIMRCVPG